MIIALALPVAAQAQSETKLIDEYKPLAGSEANARSLVTGLREGKQITLTGGGSTTTFTSPTGKMGNGNVDNALALAQGKLRQQGITNPTPEQLKSALGEILDQRAAHRGWGEIAQSMDVKLGDLKRSDKADLVARDRTERHERPERAERPEKPEKPERPERPERPEHAARGGR